MGRLREDAEELLEQVRGDDKCWYEQNDGYTDSGKISRRELDVEAWNTIEGIHDDLNRLKDEVESKDLSEKLYGMVEELRYLFKLEKTEE